VKRASEKESGDKGTKHREITQKEKEKGKRGRGGKGKEERKKGGLGCTKGKRRGEKSALSLERKCSKRKLIVYIQEKYSEIKKSSAAEAEEAEEKEEKQELFSYCLVLLRLLAAQLPFHLSALISI
jgi:hypothetical protein